ncbi:MULTISPECIES: type IV toxin-antitoxin system AbiEi family antitoxin domain-containing protein [unclassified Bradyrhizobium]|uniref:type IV toxin-antitoxin system AbiEi family antitoxin domain-containing protein n=1 Tax=unclassified Bradyrhizobium TaxID=2631580 RepID=UPI002916474A|nr:MULTISPECIES: type IV toxin-antitoxin system AbiEi family antitoxin domain-containing protein [unclassified Bradyrhizobium]
MVGQTQRPLNRLERELPEGVLVDAAWLRDHGYSRQLLSHYVKTGWLQQPARGVYRRPRGSLSWQQLVVSLQTFLKFPAVVGGRTALELHGYAHYLPQKEREIHLYGPKSLPSWVNNLRLDSRFKSHNEQRLFHKHSVASEMDRLAHSPDAKESLGLSLTAMPLGQWDWKLILSTPERAILELLDELPAHETFHQADMLMHGLANLSPRRLQSMLADCNSIKVKRLFFFFADRHAHAWLKSLKKEKFDLGTGKRLLVKGGKLDQAYQITVPEDLNGVR